MDNKIVRPKFDSPGKKNHGFSHDFSEDQVCWYHLNVIGERRHRSWFCKIQLHDHIVPVCGKKLFPLVEGFLDIQSQLGHNNILGGHFGNHS